MNPVSEAVLRFEAVSKTYVQEGRAAFDVLRDVSFSVEPGTRLAITGRSGSGKSTLLHLAAGIDTASTGGVFFEGREMEVLSDRERTLIRRDGIGLVFQFFHLLSHLSVLENVLLPAWIADDASPDMLKRARDLLERVDLGSRAQQPSPQLSGGEMQRVAICRALLRKPRLLLADEPTGNLDDNTAVLVMDLLVRLVTEDGGTLVYVTHSAELAERADRRLRLAGGSIEAT